ncbi:potassium transporter TrkA, partial [Streptomyces carpinensis]
ADAGTGEQGRREPAAQEAAETTGRASGMVWNLPQTYVLRKEDRVVLAATRRGLAELLGRRSRERSGA